MKYTRLFLFALMGLLASPSHADVFGFVNGRTANLDNLANMSVEGSATVGGDYRVIGARLNYKLSPDLVMYGNLGQASASGIDGFVYGIGAFYQLRNVTLLDNTDFAVRLGYTGGELEVKGCSNIGGFFGISFDCDVNAQEIAIEGLISGDQLGASDFGWYANVGMHLFDGSSDVGLGGGIVGSLSFGDWYAGVDFIDGAIFGAGIRYNLN